MNHRRTPLTGRAALGALLALGLVAATAFAASRPRHAREDLSPAAESPSPDASGRLTVKDIPSHGKSEDRAWIRLQAKKLVKKAAYTMYLDDPTVEGEDFQAYGDPITTRGNGNINARVDTKKGGALPFDRTLDELGGALFQLRDAEDAVVLEGVLPTLPVDDTP